MHSASGKPCIWMRTTCEECDVNFVIRIHGFVQPWPRIDQKTCFLFQHFVCFVYVPFGRCCACVSAAMHTNPILVWVSACLTQPHSHTHTRHCCLLAYSAFQQKKSIKLCDRNTKHQVVADSSNANDRMHISTRLLCRIWRVTSTCTMYIQPTFSRWTKHAQQKPNK